MNKDIKVKLIGIAKKNIQNSHSSHEIDHAMRVLRNAEYIASKEGGDLDIIIPSALFHDVIWYPKDHPKSNYAPYESAGFAAEVLSKLKGYPKEKIPQVYKSIKQCSLTKNILPNFVEAKILQDADRLDTTGAISLSRYFSSKRNISHNKIYDFRNKQPINNFEIAKDIDFDLDLFYTSIVKIKDLMHTPTGKTLAEKRTRIIEKYLIRLK